MFDLEQQQGRWIERREFLTTSKDHQTSAPITRTELQRLYSMAPADAPLVRVRALASNPRLSATLLRDTLFEDTPNETQPGGESWSWQTYSSDDFYSDDSDEGYDRYSYLDYRYDSSIDDAYDARVTEPERPGGNPVAVDLEQQFFTNVQAALASARPATAILATRPHTSDGPLFVEFRKTAIIHLQSAGNLRRDLLEKAIALAAQGRLTVAGKGSQPVWENRSEGGHAWRQLRLPMLGWEICYAVKNEDLIVTNSAELLQSVLDTSSRKSLEVPVEATDDLTIVRLDQRKSAFNDIMNRLDNDALQQQPDSKISDTFFSGNISSLLDVASDLNRIEITRRSSADGLHEEIHFVLNSPRE